MMFFGGWYDVYHCLQFLSVTYSNTVSLVAPLLTWCGGKFQRCGAREVLMKRILNVHAFLWLLLPLHYLLNNMFKGLAYLLRS